MALHLKLPEALDQHALNHRRWDSLLESGEMAKYDTQRVETDRYGHLVMSPWASAKHGVYQSEVILRLGTLLPGGRTISECPVSTSDGVKLVDAAWMSRERFEPMREFTCYEKAPEICVEVISPSNTRAEMEEKRELYFEVGCEEFWTVSASGKVRVFLPGTGEVPVSPRCPGFPTRLEIWRRPAKAGLTGAVVAGRMVVRCERPHRHVSGGFSSSPPSFASTRLSRRSAGHGALRTGEDGDPSSARSSSRSGRST